VVVADDQTTVREGLVTLLGLAPGIQVVGAAADGAQAIALTAELHPDVVLMDLGMPVVDGVTATGRIRAEHPETQVVVLTTFADDTNILAALHAGALGYLTKDAGRAQISRALHTAAAGQAVLDPAVHARLLAAATRPPPPAAAPAATGLPDGLTVREAEVLALIAAGLTNTHIAGRLFITEATVKTHSAPRGARSYPRCSRERLEEISLGPMTYPDAERRRGQQHVRKLVTVSRYRNGAPGDPCDKAKAGLLESQFPAMQLDFRRKMPDTDAASCPGIAGWPGQPPGAGRCPMRVLKGTKGTPTSRCYVRPGRTWDRLRGASPMATECP
jgi:DNA-binding NarL/FixJ family response regulator